MKVLFISRSFPPVVGGIERQNAEIAKALAQRCSVKLIANRRGKYLLPLFLPWATLRALLLLPGQDAVLLGDGVLGVTGYILKLFTSKPVVCITHGLDLTYNSSIYQRLWVRTFLPRLDRLIAVGNATLTEGVRRGIPEELFVFIPNGVSIPPSSSSTYSRRDLARLLGRQPGQTVLLTLGRLIRRKGIAWFVETVIPRLDEGITYIIAGAGPEEENIGKAITGLGLENRVYLLGSVSDPDRELLYQTADIFIQPNIPVQDDIEGFGLVVLEAAAHGRVVVAAAIEGLQDAITDGENGYLVTPADANAYCTRITALLKNPANTREFGQYARKFTLENYDWALIADRYIDIIRQVVMRQNNANNRID